MNTDLTSESELLDEFQQIEKHTDSGMMQSAAKIRSLAVDSKDSLIRCSKIIYKQ